MIRTTLTLPLIYALLLTFASCGNKNYQNSGAVWGTTYHITYSAPCDLSDSIINVMQNIEQQFSMFSPSSTVSRINRNENIKVNDDFARLFRLSQHISKLSYGAFDPTVAPLTDLWGFGRNKSDSIPDHKHIAQALSTIGIDKCLIDSSRIIKHNPDTRFDFSSIAKGYGVDAIAQMLRRNGSNNFLVEIGGEIVTSGHSPRGSQWHVQIDAPITDTLAHIALYIIPLDNAAVATSGNYRNYRSSSIGRIGHTLDPRTGYPVTTSTLSATVIAPDCATADALATACMVLDSATSMQMIRSIPDTEVLLTIADADTFAIVRSDNFPQPVR